MDGEPSENKADLYHEPKLSFNSLRLSLAKEIDQEKRKQKLSSHFGWFIYQ